MKSIPILFVFLSVMTWALTASAQQGEGTNGDFVLSTRIDQGAFSTADKVTGPFDLLTMRFVSPMGGASGSGILLAADLRPVTQDYVELGIIGLNAGTRFIVFDTITNPSNVVVPPAGQPLDFGIVLPCSPIWNLAPDLGVWLQALALHPGSPTGLVGIYEFSGTIKHRIAESPYPCSWYDHLGDALTAPGLSDADLGVTFTLDTTTFDDDVDVVVDFTVGTSTNFTMVPAGQGSSPDGLAAEGPSGDVMTRFTASGGAYTFDLCGSNYDSRIWVVTPTVPVFPYYTNPGIAYNDDAQGDPGQACAMPGHPFASRLRRVCLDPGQTVLVVIDGFGGEEGVASLVITKETNLPERVRPTFGLVTGGTAVTISGCGLMNTTSVTFDGMPATVISASNKQVVVTAPAHAAGSVDVAVSDGTTTQQLPSSFLYVQGSFNVSSQPGLSIPDADPNGVTDTLVVTATQPLTSLTVDLHISHFWTGDLAVDLTAPNGTILRLVTPTGSAGIDINGLFPDDLTPTGGGPSNGATGTLADFLGVSPAGTWTIRIEDWAPPEEGTLMSWGLIGTF